MKDIPEIGMDSKNNGGIHLWVKGSYVEKFPSGEYSISVHLTKDQLFYLITELMRRFVKGMK